MEKKKYSQFQRIKTQIQKRKVFVILGMLLVVCGMLYGRRVGQSMEYEIFKIVIIGDSLTESSIRGNGFTRILNEENYRKADIILRGFSGYSSKEIREYIDPILHKVDVNLVFLLIGTNDAKTDSLKRHSIKEYTANVYHIIHEIKRHSKDICLITPPPSYNNEIGDVKDYRNVIMKIAEELKLPIIDTWDFISNEDLFDGIHFNDIGNKKIAEGMQQVIDSYNLQKFLPN